MGITVAVFWSIPLYAVLGFKPIKMRTQTKRMPSQYFFTNWAFHKNNCLSFQRLRQFVCLNRGQCALALRFEIGLVCNCLYFPHIAFVEGRGFPGPVFRIIALWV